MVHTRAVDSPRVIQHSFVYEARQTLPERAPRTRGLDVSHTRVFRSGTKSCEPSMDPYKHKQKTSRTPSAASEHPTRSSPWESGSVPQIPQQQSRQSFGMTLNDNIHSQQNQRRSTESVATDISCTPATISETSVHNTENPAQRYATDLQSWRDNRYSPAPPTPPRSQSVASGTVVYPSSRTSQSESRRHGSPHVYSSESRHERRPQVVAMPGTMSSRPIRSESPAKGRRRATSDERQRSQSKSREVKESVPFGSRFKTAFKDIFHKNSTDPSSFERIEDKHWSDDW